MNVTDNRYRIDVEESHPFPGYVYIKVTDEPIGKWAGSHWPPEQARRIALAILDALRGNHG